MRKISENQSPQLHDATIGMIVVDYAMGIVTIGLRLSEPGTPNAELRALGFSALHLPRAAPWGPSTSVNNAAIGDENAEGVHLHLYLQSGDELVVEARTIEFFRS
jgi:hypothetical protein